MKPVYSVSSEYTWCCVGSMVHVAIYNYSEAVARRGKVVPAGKEELKRGSFSVEQEGIISIDEFLTFSHLAIALHLHIGQLFHFPSLPALVSFFSGLLLRPFYPSLNFEPWFYSDLSSEEASDVLKNQNRGNFVK